MSGLRHQVNKLQELDMTGFGEMHSERQAGHARCDGPLMLSPFASVTRMLPALDPPVHIELVQTAAVGSAGPTAKAAAATNGKQPGQAAVQVQETADTTARHIEMTHASSSEKEARVAAAGDTAAANDLDAETSSQGGAVADDTAEVRGTSSAEAAAAQELAAIAATGGVLQSIVQEVWADADVAAAFKNLKPAPVLTFEQLKQQHAFEQQKLATRQRQGMDQGAVIVASLGAIAAAADEQHEEEAAAGASPTSRDPGDAGTDGQPEQQRQQQQELKQDRVGLQRPDVLGFVDYVIDNALLGIVQEGL